MLNIKFKLYQFIHNQLLARLFNWYNRLFSKSNKKYLKVIVGASSDKQKGFLSTNIKTLNITKSLNWARLFEPNTLECLVTEHVLEHLTIKDVRKALMLCFIYLKPGGRIRIAVPDKNRKDKTYQDEVKPPKDGHLSFFNHSELLQILKDIGFGVSKLEYYDDSGEFIGNKWDDKYGRIKRSSKYDKQVKFKKGKYYYTSLIVDGVK
jgi:predicted SAM-dependent methyltransferase